MELMKFQSEQFGMVRTIDEDGTILFCGRDVAQALGYANTRDALRRHCKGGVKRDTPTEGGKQELLFISEGDLYRLITHSRLPAAEAFEKWVFDTVLPEIRRTGRSAFPMVCLGQQVVWIIQNGYSRKNQITVHSAETRSGNTL